MIPHKPGKCAGWYLPTWEADRGQCYSCIKIGNVDTFKAEGPPPKPKRMPKVKREPKRPPCIDLGPAIPLQTCGCASRIRKCDTHGQCTTAVRRDGIMCCLDCPDYDYG